MRISEFAVDPDKEEQGIWQPVGEDAVVKIARIGNPRYQEIMKRLLAPHRQAIRAGVLPEKKATDVITEAMVESVVLDWRGLEDDSGELLPYSKENARRILADPRYKDFREMLYKYADDGQLFREQEIKEDIEQVKNS